MPFSGMVGKSTAPSSNSTSGREPSRSGDGTSPVSRPRSSASGKATSGPPPPPPRPSGGISFSIKKPRFPGGPVLPARPNDTPDTKSAPSVFSHSGAAEESEEGGGDAVATTALALAAIPLPQIDTDGEAAALVASNQPVAIPVPVEEAGVQAPADRVASPGRAHSPHRSRKRDGSDVSRNRSSRKLPARGFSDAKTDFEKERRTSDGKKDKRHSRDRSSSHRDGRSIPQTHRSPRRPSPTPKSRARRFVSPARPESVPVKKFDGRVCHIPSRVVRYTISTPSVSVSGSIRQEADFTFLWDKSVRTDEATKRSDEPTKRSVSRESSMGIVIDEATNISVDLSSVALPDAPLPQLATPPPPPPPPPPPLDIDHHPRISFSLSAGVSKKPVVDAAGENHTIWAPATEGEKKAGQERPKLALDSTPINEVVPSITHVYAAFLQDLAVRKEDVPPSSGGAEKPSVETTAPSTLVCADSSLTEPVSEEAVEPIPPARSRHRGRFASPPPVVVPVKTESSEAPIKEPVSAAQRRRSRSRSPASRQRTKRHRSRTRSPRRRSGRERRESSGRKRSTLRVRERSRSRSHRRERRSGSGRKERPTESSRPRRKRSRSRSSSPSRSRSPSSRREKRRSASPVRKRSVSRWSSAQDENVAPGEKWASPKKDGRSSVVGQGEDMLVTSLPDLQMDAKEPVVSETDRPFPRVDEPVSGAVPVAFSLEGIGPLICWPYLMADGSIMLFPYLSMQKPPDPTKAEKFLLVPPQVRNDPSSGLPLNLLAIPTYDPTRCIPPPPPSATAPVNQPCKPAVVRLIKMQQQAKEREEAQAERLRAAQQKRQREKETPTPLSTSFSLTSSKTATPMVPTPRLHVDPDAEDNEEEEEEEDDESSSSGAGSLQLAPALNGMDTDEVQQNGLAVNGDEVT